MSIPPLEFLLDASNTSLQDLELNSLNLSANLARTLKRELDMWIEREATAMVARWFRENRETILKGSITIEPKKADLFEVREKKSA